MSGFITNGELRIEAERLCDENEELREQVADTCAQLDEAWARCTELREKNAKLREACAELLKMAKHHDPEWLHWPEMYEELRELGVEV